MKLETIIGTLDTIEIPPLLYKYRDWENINNKRFLTNREVYLASPDQFEDKLDCKIPVRYDLMTDKEASRFYDRLTNDSREILSRQQKRKKVRNWVKLKEYKNRVKHNENERIFFEEYFKRIGILSLTAENQLPDMWEKYANNHSGFCVGYKSRILFDHLGGGGKVHYFDKVPLIMPDPIMDRDIIRHLQVYNKEKIWEFEREYRTQKFWINGASKKDRQIQIPREAFDSVILGRNITDNNRKEIIEAVKNNLGDHVKIIEYRDL